MRVRQHAICSGLLSLTLLFPGQPSKSELTELSRTPSTEPTTSPFSAAAVQSNGVFISSGQRLGNSRSFGVALGPLDHDSDLDAFVVNNNGQVDHVWLNNGAGVFANSHQRLDSSSGFAVALGDMDRDGDLDAFIGNAYNEPNQVWWNNGAGVFTDSGQRLGSTDSRAIALGDIDADHDLDAFIVNTAGQADEIWLNNGSGTFTDSGQRLGSSDSRSVALGDLDGDHDLDSVVGHDNNQGNEVWLNNGRGIFTNSGEILGYGRTLAIALGDLDGDRDLDVFAGNFDQLPQVWLNDGAGIFSKRDQSLSSSLTHALALGDVDVDGDLDAFIVNANDQADHVLLNDGSGNFVNSGQILGNSSGMSVALGDVDGDRDLDAVVGTEGQGNEIWLNQSIVPPPEGSTYAHIVDAQGRPLAGVQVYRNGYLVTNIEGEPKVTNGAGNLILEDVQVGDTVVALSLQHEQPAVRKNHMGWAYRVYATNLTVNNDSSLHAFVVTTVSGAQTLTIKQNNTLVLFNLVISIEWDANDAYIDEIDRAVQRASDYLYDITDGQMAFGEVTIYNGGTNWADADIQISTTNIVHPYAYVGGLTADDLSHVIHLGRGWDGTSGNQGSWDEREGYRTLIHEFGHYALYLYDEYIGYDFDQNGNLIGDRETTCTGPANRNLQTDATNASVMDHQYTSSELAMQGVNGLWSENCKTTVQWQLNRHPTTGAGESDWETLIRKYADTQTPPRWQFTTPRERGGVVKGPQAGNWSAMLPRWPQVIVQQSSSSNSPRQLTVTGPQGPLKGVVVSLYKQDKRVIAQGFTDESGRLSVYGASAGDKLRAATLDGGLAGSVVVGAALQLSLHLSPVGGLTLQAAGGNPHLRVIAEPSPDSNQVDLSIVLEHFGPEAQPNILVTAPGSDVGHTPTLSYSPVTGSYIGQVHFSATARGTGRVQVVGTVAGRVMYLHTTYRLQRVSADRVQDVYADDGNLSLHLDTGSVPGATAYLVIVSPHALPGPLPTGLRLVGGPYAVTASGALVQLERPALLTLHYDRVFTSLAAAGLGIYRWDPNSMTWREVRGQLDVLPQALVAPVTVLGTYALLAPSELRRIFLPCVLTRAP
jgi:hypothetical protein